MPHRMKKARFEKLYREYNRREFVHPDPLQFLYHYNDPREREIVAFVASSLAYGRVERILRSVSVVLARMTPTPSVFLRRASRKTLDRTFCGFRHRFTDGYKFSAMLFGLKEILERYGSLRTCFCQGLGDKEDTILPALCAFVDQLAAYAEEPLEHLVPSPSKGSACKRLNLFLRWMVRCDAVDPGGWHEVSPSRLIIPLDTHMRRICHLLGFTHRKQADMGMAQEITEAFRVFAPTDPVRYDFSLTRLGIRKERDVETSLAQLQSA